MSLTIKLSDGIDSRRVFPGTLLTGTVTLALPKQKTITNAKILFTGKIVTEYSEVRVGTAGNTHGPRRHAIERIILFSFENVFFPGPFTVPAQTFDWPLEFEVPRHVECERRSTDESRIHQSLPFVNSGRCDTPPTVEWRDSTTAHVVTARVKYKLVASVDTGSGLFKHTTKQKLPIAVPSIIDHALLSKTLRPMLESRMKWHGFPKEYYSRQGLFNKRTQDYWGTGFRAAFSFPNRIPVPYPDSFTTDMQSGSSFPEKFQFRISLFPKARCAATLLEYKFSDYPSSFLVKVANLTLGQIVTVRVASTPRLVRNVGTKIIASGGQGYDTNDVLVTRNEVLLSEYPISDAGILKEQPEYANTGIADIDLSKWAQAVSKIFTELAGRSNANEQPDGKGKKRSSSIKNAPVAGFKSYTVSVQHSVTVEIDLCYGEAGDEEHWFLKADCPIMIGGFSNSDTKTGELAHSASKGQDQAQNKYETPKSSAHSKEQEALQDRSNSANHSQHGILDGELPRYEENAEAPPPPSPPISPVTHV